MRNVNIGISADALSVSIWSRLHEDFDLGSTFGEAKEALLSGDLTAFRKSCTREVGHVSPLRFKQIQQMQNLLKKYRFESDAYTATELEEITNNKYLENQVRLAKSRLKQGGQCTFLVLQEARRIVKRILGRISDQDVIALAKFGKKSSIGCPLSLAYIDHKLTDRRAFTGSVACADWFFNDVLPKDNILERIVRRLDVSPADHNLQHCFLKLENVPKTWKVHRGITPLTLLDLFYTYGVGRLVQQKLKEHGLDIRHLQDTHRHLVKGFSSSRTHATADLSAASDSITSDLLNKLLPREWYVAVKRASTHQVKIGDKLYYTESVLPMGNGLTFPIETLVFFSIVKAIGNLSGVKRGVFSVFGDDLIYPSRIHRYVSHIFPRMGLVLNPDKTYVRFPFRESCGEDFYQGFPVRSYYLGNPESTTLFGRRLEAHLYKIINGLLRRWDEHEISKTLNFLLQILSNTTFRVLRVPPLFPDTSGIKVNDPNHRLIGNAWIPYEPISLFYADGSRWFQFHYLRAIAKKRFIKDLEPYYWQTLSGDTDEPESFERHFSMYTETPRPVINWQKNVYKRTKKVRGRPVVLKKTVKRPYVASRVIESFKIQQNGRQSCSDWI